VSSVCGHRSALPCAPMPAAAALQGKVCAEETSYTRSRLSATGRIATSQRSRPVAQSPGNGPTVDQQGQVVGRSRASRTSGDMCGCPANCSARRSKTSNNHRQIIEDILIIRGDFVKTASSRPFDASLSTDVAGADPSGIEAKWSDRASPTEHRLSAPLISAVENGTDGLFQ
jgi:hypothetical protein